jgi:Transcriptional regulator, AbiEi antitoxin
MRGQSRTAEQILARIATGQHGVVTRKQLLDAGVSSSAIDRRVSKGTLIVEYRGIFRVGHAAPSREANYMAAVLASGAHGLLCDAAAGHLWGLVKGVAPAPSVVAPTERRVPGLRTRRCRGLTRADATVRLGIPVTTVARTLVDLTAQLDPGSLARACHEAGVLHRTTPRQVDAALARSPNSPGGAQLRRILRGDEPVTLSRLERAFLARLRAARLPLPVTNKPAGTKRVDCRWPEHRLTVELDSFRFHNSRYSWEQGHRREREARARGDEFRRYTWGDVVEGPSQMLPELANLLAPS